MKIVLSKLIDRTRSVRRIRSYIITRKRRICFSRRSIKNKTEVHCGGKIFSDVKFKESCKNFVFLKLTEIQNFRKWNFYSKTYNIDKLKMQSHEEDSLL